MTEQTIRVVWEKDEYFIKPSKKKGCYDVYNVKEDKQYVVNPTKGLCTIGGEVCPDLKFRGKEKCKHITMTRENVPALKQQQDLGASFKRASEELPQQPEPPPEKSEVKEKAMKIAKEARTDLVPADQVDLELLFDRFDTDQALAIVKGEVLDKYVNEMDIDGKKVYDLSLVGKIDIAHHMGGFAEDMPITDEREDEWVAKIRITDTLRKMIVWGYATQEKIWSTGKKKGQPVHLPERVSIGKARANGYGKLIPEHTKQRVIKMYKEYKKESKSPRTRSKK